MAPKSWKLKLANAELRAEIDAVLEALQASR